MVSSRFLSVAGSSVVVMAGTVPAVVSGFAVTAAGPGVFVLDPAPGDAALIDRVLAGPLGPGTLAELVGVDPAGLAGADRVGLIQAFERVNRPGSGGGTELPEGWCHACTEEVPGRAS